MKKDIITAALLSVVLTAASYLVGRALGWLPAEVNGFEVGATVLNYASFYLSVKQRRLFYILGFLASALFIVTYFQVGLLASAGLSAYLTISLIVGFFMWGRDSKALPVTHLAAKWAPMYIVITALAYLGAVVLVSSLGGELAFWDSAILIFSLLGQFMLDRKKVENWWVWIIGVNGAGTILYFSTGLYFVAIQQLLFGLASVWGWWEWRKSMETITFYGSPVKSESKLYVPAEGDIMTDGTETLIWNADKEEWVAA